MKVKSTRRPEAPTAETWPVIRDAIPPRDQSMFQASLKTARRSPTGCTKIALWFQPGGVSCPCANQKNPYILGARRYCHGLPYTSYLIIISYSILRRGLFAVRVSSRSRRVRSTVLVLLRRHCYCVARVHTEGPCAAGRVGTKFGMVYSQCKHGVSCILEGQLVSLRSTLEEED